MKNVEIIFVRRTLENMLDQGEQETVMEMSRRIDELMMRRIRRETAEAQAAL